MIVPAQRRYLTTERGQLVSSSTKQGIQKRMQKLQKQIFRYRKQVIEREKKTPWRLPRPTKVICMIFEALEAEHNYV